MGASSTYKLAVIMKSWYDGTNLTQTSIDVSRISVSGAKGQKNAMNNSRKAKLEAELKLLEWHKLANDAALKVGTDFYQVYI